MRQTIEQLARLETLEGATRRARPPDLLRDSFSAQRRFVEDDRSRFGYAFCSRRAAKSYSGGLKAYRRALAGKCNVLIAGLVRDEAKRIWWHPILRDIAQRFGVECRFNETELSVRFPNGSWIYLLGMDADERQKRKALGQKYALVLIDEAQDWATNLHDLVFHVLKPGVADYGGSIWLLGTPGLVAKGLFYDVTTGAEPGWTRHEWTTHENTTRPDPSLPRISEQWANEIADLKVRKPGVEATPWFRRNYLRQWVVDEDALVYRYAAARNSFAALPSYRRGEWTYVLGCDLGYSDATALVVGAYHPHDRALHLLEAHSATGLDVTDVAGRAKALNRKYDFAAWVVDGANKQAVEEMVRRHEIPWRAADKTGKSDFIELMNAEFLTGGVRVHATDAAPLAREYQSLIWDQRKLADGRREEDARCDNHCADAALYLWRYAYPYLATALPPEAPPPGSDEWRAREVARVEREGERMVEAWEAEAEEATRQRREQAGDERDAEVYL